MNKEQLQRAVDTPQVAAPAKGGKSYHGGLVDLD